MMRAASSSYHASRVLIERTALVEGVRRLSCCRLVSSIKAQSCMSTAACSCCRRRRFASTLSRIREPNWHYYYHNMHRQFSSLTPCRGGYLMERPTLASTNFLYHASTSIFPRALGATTSVHFTSLNYARNGWKYGCGRMTYHSRRNFATGANNSSTTKPNPTCDADDAETPKESKTSVPKEYIDAIKSEVDEMEAASHPPTNDQQRFTRARRTQDDFADYLKGGEASKTSVLDREDTLQSERRAISASDESDEATSDKSNDNTSSKPSTDDPTQQQHSAYSYKFSPTDATLTDPKRHIHRQRAMEQKLQEQQAISRATTMKNVQRALGGNFIIASAKLAAAISSGSSAMLSEFVHSVVDCGNQALLLVGLNTSKQAPDRSHPYGYGKAIYFWALVSALGTFFLGAGISMTHAVGELMHPSMTAEVPKEVWGVLLMSFTVDGYVFGKTVQGIRASMRIDDDGSNKNMSFWRYATTKVRDPATLAVLLEDGAACLGVVLAIGGIGLTQYTGMPIFDGMAGVCISALLAAMGMTLANLNHRFLIGQGLDRATREDIEKIILSRRSIDNVYSVQSQWTGPDTFSYKAEVDFDGTFLAAKLLPRYQQEFFDANKSLDRDLHVLLSWYAEDVMRAVEREVRHIEEEIRIKYPAAHFIELEPMSKEADRYAIDDGVEAQLRRVEIDVLNRYLKSLYKIKEADPTSGVGTETDHAPSLKPEDKQSTK